MRTTEDRVILARIFTRSIVLVAILGSILVARSTDAAELIFNTQDFTPSS